MAKNDAELQALEQPKSRNEEYLNFLCGRAVDINALPNPYSRVEHYLEYLCHNRGQGGGGGQPFNGVTNVTYNAQTKELVVTHSNGLIDNLNLSNLSDVTDVQYDNNTHIMTVTRNGVPSEIDLSKLNTKINNVAPVDGNIQLALNQAGDDISLTVGGQNAGTVSLNGYVKTVNNQPNQGGNVTVDAEHINYDTTNTNLNHQNVQDVLDYLEEDKASLNKNNVFIGHNTFNEVNLLGKNVFVSTVGGKQNSAHKTDIYCGDRRVSTHHNGSPNPKYISAIKIEVLPSVNVGDMVSGVYVTEIEKKADRLTDIVGETIINDGSFIVEEDETGAKVIYVPIQKEYTVDTYFLVGKTGDRNLREAWEGYPPQEEYINNLPINNLPQIGNQLNWTTGNGWIIIYSLTDDEMNVREELKLLNDKVNNANRGKVTSVNKQQPNDLGEVIVNAEHISYNNQTSNLISDNVKEAIDELNGKFVSNVSFVEATRTLKQTKNNQESDVVTGLVTRWKHLEHVTESNTFNIFNPTTFIDGHYYGVNGVVVPNTNWGHFNIPCSANETFTVFKKRYDSKNFGLLDSNVNWFSNLVVNSTTDGVWQKFTVNIPQDQRVVYLSIPVYKVDNDYRNEVMVFRGNVQAPAEFIPFTNNREISIDGEKVNISFEASTTTLSTNNIVDAIKELDMKVANAGAGTVTSVNTIEPINGDVTITSSDIDYDNQTSGLTANKIQGAIDELKRDMDLIDSSEVRILADKTELDNLLGQGILSKGDIIYIIDSNGVVDFNGTDVGNNGNPIAMIYDTDIPVPPNNNHLRVFSRFNTPIHITATNVEYDDNNTQLQANNVQDAIGKLNEKIANAGGTVTSVNGINPQGGEVTLTATVTQNVGQDIVFQVGNQANFATLQCMTNQDVTTIIDGFIL